MEEETVLLFHEESAAGTEVRLEQEEDEEFRSCCEDEDELKEREESAKADLEEEIDEFSVELFFKGVSIAQPGDAGCGFSGVGVIMERSGKFPDIKVQKKLDFYVEELVADYLALMDGLSEAVQNNITRVLAFTDSQILYDQITLEEGLENPLLVALREKILEYSNSLEAFALKLAPVIDLDGALWLAQVAVGIITPTRGNELVESCSICCEEKIAQMMITMKCSHEFCSHCMKTYVEGKLELSQVPIKCPQPRCKYLISTTECKSFLPVSSYELLEKAFSEANVTNSDQIYCPFPNCSVLLDPNECLFSRASSSSRSDNSRVDCPVCQRFICIECGVPWHSFMNCEEYQNLPLEERDAGDITSHRLAQNRKWKRCQHCRRMIELTDGCYHMTCRCGHEFCYSCGAEYRNGQQMCQCVFWDDEYSEDFGTQPHQQFEQWAWDSFDSVPLTMDAYSDQERSQLALIQRFLAGGFSLSDHNPYQSPPRCTDSYMDAMKDLHQLPWLERFVSVISDNYYEDYI